MPASCIRKRISNDWLSFVVGLEVRPRNQHGYSSMCRSTLSPCHWHLVVVDRFFGDGQGALLHLPPEQWNVGGTHLGNRLHICLYLKRGRFCALECALSVCFSLSLYHSLSLPPCALKWCSETCKHIQSGLWACNFGHASQKVEEIHSSNGFSMFPRLAICSEQNSRFRDAVQSCLENIKK